MCRRIIVLLQGENMKNTKRPYLAVLLFAVLVVTSLALNACDYITGEAIKVPAQIQPQLVKNITSPEAYALIQVNAGNGDFIIIDVRTPEEYASGHIENAVNVDYNSANFRDEISSFNRDSTYLIYCRTGARSAGARDVMKELGFQKIYNMTGGITEWEAAGLPVVK
jgi:rhodanese-related sulfurtransferase